MDFEKVLWVCPACSEPRKDNFIRFATHDISSLLGIDTGIIFLHCRYCSDKPACKEKAYTRDWVLEHYLKNKIK